MTCARCLLRLRPLGLVAQSSGAAPRIRRSAHSDRPGLPSQSQSQLQQVSRHFHGSPGWAKNEPASREKTDKHLVGRDDPFEQVAREARAKAMFTEVLDIFLKRDIRRRGHVEFIYAALKKMPEYGVEKDLAVYNKLLDVFPKEVFVPRNFIQRMYNHYPRQQECGVQLLQQMETYGIMPNVETKVLLVQIFGEKSHPMRKYQRLMYWFPKFKNLNPYPLPHRLPDDPVALADLSLRRMANDLDAKVTIYQAHCTDVTEEGEEITLPHIVGIQGPSQMELLAKHNPSKPVFVEGPFPLWLRKTCVHYYVLRADPVPPEEKVEEPYDPERSLAYPLQLDLDLHVDMGDDESFDVEDFDEGPVFAMCMAGLGDQATLGRWISGLQESNPMLGRVPTLFRLTPAPAELPAPERPRGPQDDDAELVEEEGPRRSRGAEQ